MKPFVLISALYFLFSCVPVKKDTSGTDVTIGFTEIRFNEKIHDFGVLKSGEIVLSTFAFTNIGENNLVIKDIESDCGCLRVKFSKEQIKPGKTGLIEVEFDSSGMVGKQFKSIEMNVNCKEPKHLAIFAEIKNKHLEFKY